MKSRSLGLGMSIGFVIVWSTLAAASASFAETVEREIPVRKDAEGNNLTVVLTREGERRTATPSLTIGERAANRAAAGGEEIAGAAAAETARIPLPVDANEEITFRNARKVVREFRSRWKSGGASEAH